MSQMPFVPDLQPPQSALRALRARVEELTTELHRLLLLPSDDARSSPGALAERVRGVAADAVALRGSVLATADSLGVVVTWADEAGLEAALADLAAAFARRTIAGQTRPLLEAIAADLEAGSVRARRECVRRQLDAHRVAALAEVRAALAAERPADLPDLTSREGSTPAGWLREAFALDEAGLEQLLAALEPGYPSLHAFLASVEPAQWEAGAPAPSTEDSSPPALSPPPPPLPPPPAPPQEAPAREELPADREEAPAPGVAAGPRVSTEWTRQVERLDARLPPHLATFPAFEEARWISPDGQCRPVPWGAGDFPARLRGAIDRALAEGDLVALWVHNRAAALLGLEPVVEPADIEALAEVWDAPRSTALPGNWVSRGLADRLARLEVKVGEPPAVVETPLCRVPLFLVAVRPGPEVSRVWPEMTLLAPQAFRDRALRGVVCGLLRLAAQGALNPLERLRVGLQAETVLTAEKARAELTRSRNDFHDELRRVWSAAGGKVERTHCRQAWQAFIDEAAPPLTPLYPPAAGGQPTWDVTALEQVIDRLTRLHARIADDHGARYQDRHKMDRAAKGLAKKAEAVNKAMRRVQELERDEGQGAALDLPLDDARHLLARHPVGDSLTQFPGPDEELLRRLLLRLLAPEDALVGPGPGPAPGVLDLTMAHLLRYPALLGLLEGLELMDITGEAGEPWHAPVRSLLTPHQPAADARPPAPPGCKLRGRCRELTAGSAGPTDWTPPGRQLRGRCRELTAGSAGPGGSPAVLAVCRAAAVWLEGPARSLDGPGPASRVTEGGDPSGGDAVGGSFDDLRRWLKRHRPDLLGVLAAGLSEQDQELAHRQRAATLEDGWEVVGDLDHLWGDLDELGTALHGGSLRAIVQDARRRLDERDELLREPTLLLAWLTEVRALARAVRDRVVAHLKERAESQEPAPAGPASRASQVLAALAAEHYAHALWLLGERAELGQPTYRETMWRPEARARFPDLFEALGGVSDELRDAWVRGVTVGAGSHKVAQKLRRVFAEFVFGGAVFGGDLAFDRAGRKGEPTLYEQRDPLTDDHFRLACGLIRAHIARQRLNPCFLPQLADFGHLVIATPPVPPTDPAFVQQTAALVSAWPSNDVVVVLAPRLTATIRERLHETLHARQVVAAVIDDLDLLRLVNPLGQRPNPVLGLFELVLEQQPGPASRVSQGWVSSAPFAAPDGQQVKMEMYVGRAGEARELARGSDVSRLFSGRKLGKSALLKFIEQTEAGQRLPSGNILRVLYVPAAGAETEADVVDRIRTELADRLGFAAGDPPAGPASRVSQVGAGGDGALEATFRRFAQERPEENLLVVLDESDVFVEAQVEEYEKPHRRERCLSFQMRSVIEARKDASGHPRVRFVFSGYRATHTTEGAWNNWGKVLRLAPLDPEEAARLIAGPLARLGIDAARQAPAIAYRCGYQPAIILTFGDHLLQHLAEAGPRDRERLLVGPGDVSAVFNRPAVQEAIRRVVQQNFQGNRLGLILFSALLLEFAELPPGAELEDAPARVLDRLGRLGPLDWLTGSDTSHHGAVVHQLRDFVERRLLRERRDPSGVVWHRLEFPHHLPVLYQPDQESVVRAEIQARRQELLAYGPGSPAGTPRGIGGAGPRGIPAPTPPGARALLPPRRLAELRAAVLQPRDADVPVRAAVVGSLWPEGVAHRSGGLADRLGIAPDRVVAAPGAVTPALLAASPLVVHGVSPADAEALLACQTRPAGQPPGQNAPLLAGGADLLRWALAQTDLYEVFGLERLGPAVLRWWFERVRSLTFTAGDALDAITARTGGVPLLVGLFDRLLLEGGGGGGGFHVDRDAFGAADAAFQGALPRLARQLVEGPPAFRLLERERQVLAMLAAVGRENGFADLDPLEHLTDGWALYDPAGRVAPLSGADRPAVLLLQMLGLVPANPDRPAVLALERLAALRPGDPLLGLVAHLEGGTVIVHVQLAGCTRARRFAHSEALDFWLAGRPWVGAGGVEVVRVASADCAAELAPPLERAVRSHDDGASEVVVRLLPRPAAHLAPAPGFREAVLAALQVPPTLGRRDTLRRAADALTFRPWVFLVPPLPPGLGVAWHDGAALFLDELATSSPGQGHAPPRFTAIFLDTPEAPVRGKAFDLTTGGPSAPLGDLTDRDSNLWRAYVHTRLAWETAGNLVHAREWAGGPASRNAAALPVGKDDQFEGLLNDLARATAEQLPASRVEVVLRYLGALAGPQVNTGVSVARDLARELTGAGLLWRPAGLTTPRLVPWLARALLPLDDGAGLPGAADLLRGCLVCAPLAKDLLNRCFDLEARARARLGAAASTCPAPAEILERRDRFRRNENSPEYPLYPPGCPAAPDDPWAFATLGELLFNLHLSRSRHPALHDLRDLRNCLSHGHYVGWHAITCLRKVERDLDE